MSLFNPIEPAATVTHGHTSALLHGGGIDSTALLLTLLLTNQLKGLFVVHVDYGHVAAWAEKKAIKYQLDLIKERCNIVIPFVGLSVAMPSELTAKCLLFTRKKDHTAELPGRNATLLQRVSAAFPHVSSIFVGAAPTNQCFIDASEQFFVDAEIALNSTIQTEKLSIKVPMQSTMTVDAYEDMVASFYKSNDPIVSPFMNSAMTCWLPKKDHEEVITCKTCEHCLKEQRLRFRASKLK